MGRSRSLKLKEWPPSHAMLDIGPKPASPSSPSPSSLAASLPSSPSAWPPLLIWVSVFLMVGLSGYDLGDVYHDSINRMWINQLFTEYNPPGPVHLHLSQERRGTLSKNFLEPSGLWSPPKSDGWKPCIDKNSNRNKIQIQERRYIQVFCTGGLFQLHICVCNAVAVAWLLNSSLVVPHFLESVVWKDPSDFHDLYDIDHFVSSLKKDVHIVSRLPFEYGWSTPNYYDRKCLERPNCLFFVPKHARKDWYFENVLPIIDRYGVAALGRFHHNLAFEGLPKEATRLRCKTNFYALRFVKPIMDFGQKLVERMQLKGASLGIQSNSINPGMKETEQVEHQGHFLGVHLRFEKDMIAHSACYYGGGRAELRALASYRHKTFRNVVPKSQFSADYLRRNGSCPLTPEEVGLLLLGLGFKNSTPIYVAGKDIYGGKARISPFKEMFPFLYTKLSLASKEELKRFLPFSHKLAALDFLVLLGSDAFLSNAAGNFPNVLTGHRTFIGPKKSIHPDKAALFGLFSNSSLSWKDFSSAVKLVHKDRLGAPRPRMERFSIFRYPAPDCMCQKVKH